MSDNTASVIIVTVCVAAAMLIMYLDSRRK